MAWKDLTRVLKQKDRKNEATYHRLKTAYTSYKCIESGDICGE